MKSTCISDTLNAETKLPHARCLECIQFTVSQQCMEVSCQPLSLGRSAQYLWESQTRCEGSVKPVTDQALACNGYLTKGMHCNREHAST
jgi:hypothetical protein